MFTIKGSWTPGRFFQLHGKGTIEIECNEYNNDDALITLADGTFLSTGESHFLFETWS